MGMCTSSTHRLRLIASPGWLCDLCESPPCSGTQRCHFPPLGWSEDKTLDMWCWRSLGSRVWSCRRSALPTAGAALLGRPPSRWDWTGRPGTRGSVRRRRRRWEAWCCTAEQLDCQSVRYKLGNLRQRQVSKWGKKGKGEREGKGLSEELRTREKGDTSGRRWFWEMAVAVVAAAAASINHTATTGEHCYGCKWRRTLCVTAYDHYKHYCCCCCCSWLQAVSSVTVDRGRRRDAKHD